MISLEAAKNLTHGEIIYHISHRNADQTPQRWRINGKVKTWRTRPQEISIPIKHGLYDYGYLTHNDLDLVCLSEAEAEIVTNSGTEIGHYDYLYRNIKHRDYIYGCVLPQADRLQRSIIVGGDRTIDDQGVTTITGGITYYFPIGEESGLN